MLAIIIPYFKLTFFEETLQSLARQTDKRFKVYIGDDASPEEPISLLEKFKNRFDFVYHRFENNLGGISLVKQWERCIALAENEEWLMILGDDDVLDNNVVRLFYENLDDIVKTSKVVRFATKILDEKTGTLSEIFLQPKYEMVVDSYFRRFKKLTRSSLSEYIFSKTLYLKYGFQDYPLGWHSDDYAWLNFSDNKPIFSINDSFVFIRVSSISISGNIENFEQKNIATKQFLKDSIANKLRIFSKIQRLELLYAFEVTVKKERKLNLSEWLFLLKYYLRNFKFTPFYKFNRRFLISIFKR